MMKTKNKEAIDVAFIPPFAYLVPLVIGLALHFWVLPLRLFPNALVGRVVGWPFFVISIFLSIWAMKTIRSEGEHADVRKPTNKLVTSKPFSFSRNPMYLSLNLLYLGVGFLANTLWPIIFYPFALAAIHYGVIFREERYLERLFGEEYLKYQAKVRRWF